jgi:hypothetical protein
MDPRIAANIITLSLFRFGQVDVGQLFRQLWHKPIDIMCLFATETLFARRFDAGIVSSAELQLRATFLARFDPIFVHKALDHYCIE